MGWVSLEVVIPIVVVIVKVVGPVKEKARL